MKDEQIGMLIISVVLGAGLFFVMTAWPLLLLGMVIGLGFMCFMKN